MRVLVTIQTPPGQAGKTEPMLRKMILGLFKKATNTQINQEDSELKWTLDCTLSQAMGFQRNATMFQTLATKTMNS